MEAFLLPILMTLYLAAVGLLGALIRWVSPPWLERILSIRVW